MCGITSESTREQKKTLGMPKKNALIDCRMTSDRAGLNCELYGLDFGHCELLSKSVCARYDQTAFIDKLSISSNTYSLIV